MKEVEQKGICVNSKFMCRNCRTCESGNEYVCILCSKIEKGTLTQDGIKKEEIYFSNNCNLDKQKESNIVLENKEDIKQRHDLDSVFACLTEMLGVQMKEGSIDKEQEKADYERDKRYINKHVARTFSLTCSICGLTETIQKRREYIEDVFLDRGWNVDIDNVYCSRCSLKNRKE